MSFIVNNFFYNWPCIQKRAGVALGHHRGDCRGNAILVPSEVGPVFHDRRQDVGREARTAAKDGHEYGTVRARVGGKAAGGLHSMQILESSGFAARITRTRGIANYLITSPEPVVAFRDHSARTQEQWYDAAATVAV